MMLDQQMDQRRGKENIEERGGTAKMGKKRRRGVGL
jgi:hypothetical protein